MHDTMKRKRSVVLLNFTYLPKDKWKQAVLQAKKSGKYIGFDLSFALENAHKLDSQLFQNVKVVLTEELIRSLLQLKTEKNFKANYCLNQINAISQVGKLIVIPETKYPIRFKEYLLEWKLTDRNPLHRIIGYYLKLQSERDCEIVLLTNESIDESLKNSLPLQIL
jgi:hypothetical protein